MRAKSQGHVGATNSSPPRKPSCMQRHNHARTQTNEPAAKCALSCTYKPARQASKLESSQTHEQ
eukprot:3109915-Alexandrium_andersonii.AAC.1